MNRLNWCRAAVFVLFTVFGLEIATWAVHIPSVQQRTAVSSGTLGTLLLLFGAGALLGMQASGPLINRWGGGRVAFLGSVAMTSALALPLNAPSPWWLAGGLTTFGLASGITDVAMNARAVTVEQQVGKPIMSAFHAMFSVGSVVGSLVGAATLAAGWGMSLTAGAMCGGCLVLVGITAPNLWSVPAEAATDAGPAAEDATVGPTGKRRRLILLGALAFLLLLTEGSAMDWSSLHAQEHLGVSKATGALAFAAFVTAMTLGRFTADQIATRRGPVWVVRYGGVLSVVGLAVVVASGALPLTLVGWAIFGFGLSGALPQVFSAAGNVVGANGTDFSRVVGCGYVALLAGPAVIGWLSELVTLNLALLLPMVAVAAAALGAPAVAGDEIHAVATDVRS